VKPPDKTTEELIQEIKQGLNVEENFRQLFERNYKRVRSYFLNKKLSPEDSAELTQMTFIAVYKGLKGFRQEAPFENWLFSIAKNIWRSELERRNTVKRHAHHIPLEVDVKGGSDRHEPPVAPPVDPAPDPENYTIEKEKLQMLHEAMRQLPKQMRRCVELRVIYELSYKEIAELMGISVGAVRAHLHEAKKKLVERLRPYFGEIEL
jgi:RNA polymerase sigma-70 factor, ECF subfamily